MMYLNEGGPFVITANSVPDLDDWGFDDWWTCNDWITWHALVKNAYGREEANRQIIHWWDQMTFGAGPLDCRSLNIEFIEYAKREGFHDGLFGGPLTILKPISAGTQIISGASNAAGNFGSNLDTTLKWVLPATLLGLFGLAAIYIKNRQ